MIVSWNWLKEYVPLDMSAEQLTDRLTLSGLNLEGTQQLEDDLAIDLEVTSNRPDCLGHIGVAREVSVLWESELQIPAAKPKESKTAANSLTNVDIDCLDLCPRYTARVIRGVKVGPSPEWLAARLGTLGLAVVNNIVDISNYVMLECGQPLHAFDFQQLAEQRIVVREARAKEQFTAIDHRSYELEPGMCVIADAKRAVALGGVMGGADSEVSDDTTDLLIEAADFDPLSVRNTARRLNLHSPSSHRFERGVDPQGVDWASRRCCELILELAGGELAAGAVDVGGSSQERQPIVLRLSQLPRILGIDVPSSDVRKILVALGAEEMRADDAQVEVVPPSWRADLTREIDLVEEVGRIHGYDKIPEDVSVPMAPSRQSRDDIVLARVREVLVAGGFDEAMTISAVEPQLIETFRPWTEAEPIRSATPVLRRADRLRQTILPSLLVARRHNETLSNATIELFEVARVYLPRPADLPDERRMLAVTSGRDLLAVKSVLEGIIARVAPSQRLQVVSSQLPFFAAPRGCQLLLDDRPLGWLGELASQALDQFELRGSTTVAEIDLGVLVEAAQLVPEARQLSPYPPVERDLNVVFAESVRWTDVDEIVRDTSGDLLETLSFREVYRDQSRLGAGKKSLLFSLRLRSHTGTLTNEEADALRDRVVARLAKELGGALRA